MISIPHEQVVIPVGQDLYLDVKQNTGSWARGEKTATIAATAQSVFTLPFKPVCSEWVEVYQNRRRILNPRVKNREGGVLFEEYNVIGNVLRFTKPQYGLFTIICDTKATHDPKALVIPIQNVQGYKSTKASLYIEPVIMEQPQNGYARLSTDRKSMVYKPKTGFLGTDVFSYCLINNHGQYSRNYCVNLTITG